MEISDVRKRVTETIERARRSSQERRHRVDGATADFGQFLERIGVPLCRQIANALKAAGYPFSVNTPSGAVRLVSERSGDDYIELTLDPESEGPWVVGRTHRTWGRRTIDAERPIRQCPIRDLTEEDLLSFLMKELEPFVSR
jgi:hypothetical protein